MSESFGIKSGQAPQARGNKELANRAAAIALTIHRFMDLMFAEIERAGFQSHEFLTKAEFFLRSVTSVYSDDKFEQVLSTLRQVDEKFPETRFYYGLTTMRKLCLQQGDVELDIVQPSGKSVIEKIAATDSEVVFFASFLIENMIRFIQELRKSGQSSNMTIPQICERIDDEFDECVIKTVMAMN